MKKIILFNLITFLFLNTKAQGNFNDSSTNYCLKEIRRIACPDSFEISQYDSLKLTNDTALIRYMLTMPKFDKQSMRRMKQSSVYLSKSGYEFYKHGDSVLHYLDFCLLSVFEFRFLCITYKKNIIKRGLSLEAGYSSSCIDKNSKNKSGFSMFTPQLFPVLIILAKNYKTDIIGCGLLLIDDWDSLFKKYAEFSKKK